MILTGAPGVGKTTVARRVAARSDRAVHIESDHFFHFIQSGYVEPWRPEANEQNRTVMRIVADAAASYAAAGYVTVVDGIVIPGWFLEPMRDSLRAAGHDVAYVALRAPLSVCIARTRSRDPRLLADPGVVERLWRDFAALGALESHVIEIGTSSPDDVAEQVAKRFREGSLMT